MDIVWKTASEIPVSLHDMRVCKILSVGDDLKFCFEYGYILLGEPAQQVDGDMQPWRLLSGRRYWHRHCCVSCQPHSSWPLGSRSRLLKT